MMLFYQIDSTRWVCPNDYFKVEWRESKTMITTELDLFAELPSYEGISECKYNIFTFLGIHIL